MRFAAGNPPGSVVAAQRRVEVEARLAIIVSVRVIEPIREKFRIALLVGHAQTADRSKFRKFRQ